MSRTLQCCKCSKFLSNSLLYMLGRYNGKESINWLWFGSFCNVRLEYRLYYSWQTTHTTYCIHNMFKYTKSSEVNPQKNKHKKMAQTFSLLWDTIWWSQKRERLWLLLNLGWEERRKNVALCTFLLLKLGDQMLCPYIIQQLQTVWHWKLLGFIQTCRKMQQPIHQFKEEKALSFVSRKSRC